MRIAIVSMDTRGGIQPYVALGLGLQQAGHAVRMVAPADAAAMLAGVGLDHAPLSGSVEDVLRGAGGVTERGTLASMRLARRETGSRIAAWTRETLEGCAGVEVVAGGVGGMVVGLSVAERLRRPFIEAHLQPIEAPTSAYQGALFGSTPRWLGPLGRRASHTASDLGLWLPFRSGMASARREVLGLAGRPTAADGQPVLYGFSRHVVPVPADARRDRVVAGYWFLRAREDWRPPPGLEAFLTAPGPVVSIGFGSMANEDPAAVNRLVLGAIRRCGVRAVLLSGWGGLAPEAGDDVFVADALPHDWLFPRVTAVVHHGGAGTTGAGLRAGVPSVVIPFAVDQPFWASRVEALGVGPSPIPRRQLTEDRLAGALSQAIADEGMRSRAGAFGTVIRAEDGVGAAVRVFERL